MTATLYAVTFDCVDASRLARFWSGVLERAVDPGATEDFAAIGLEDDAASRPHWMFIRVPESKELKNRVHVDLIAADLDAEVGRVVRLGAGRRADLEEAGNRWITLVDPEGNEFDIVAEQG
jgi:Glyoxalase-like domain